MARKTYYDIKIDGKIREWGKAIFFGNTSVPKSVTKDVICKYHKRIGWITTMKIEKWWVDKQPEYIFKDLIVKKENLLTAKKVLKIFADYNYHNIDGNIVIHIEVGKDNTTYVSSALRSLGLEDLINPLKTLKAKGLIHLMTNDDTLFVELKKDFIKDLELPKEKKDDSNNGSA